ncbi:HIGH MOBILITY GROUP B PROTEIN 13, partial [Salix koriyanagi]
MTLPFIQVLNEKEQDKKKKKGGNEIKRPCPPYSLWCKDQWNEVKKENPNAEFKDISHILGTAMELLEQYLQFKQEADQGENKKNKTKKEKDPLKPKQPVSAFFLFSNERRAALLAENKNVLEVAKIAGEEWKNMTEKQKGPYEKIAKKNKEKYTQEMEAYKQNKDEEAMNLKK